MTLLELTETTQYMSLKSIYLRGCAANSRLPVRWLKLQQTILLSMRSTYCHRILPLAFSAHAEYHPAELSPYWIKIYIYSGVARILLRGVEV